jgi:L-tyrosine isonitrile synthase
MPSCDAMFEPGTKLAVVSKEDISTNTEGTARPQRFGNKAVDGVLAIKTAPRAKEIAPEKVLQTFNTWAFKREQPDNSVAMLQSISKSTTAKNPVPFVLYWGKGPRSNIDKPDIECLNYLAAFTRRISETYAPGAALRLIFTDTHAELNGHSSPDIRQYFDEVAAGARERGFESCWLGELTKAAEADNTSPLIEEIVPEPTFQRLLASAMKWYRGNGSCEEGALKYYRMNMVEKRAVERAFPESIFITFNGSEFRGLFPQNLPIFYMYSLRKGISIKPWFLFQDTAACEHRAS